MFLKNFSSSRWTSRTPVSAAFVVLLAGCSSGLTVSKAVTNSSASLQSPITTSGTLLNAYVPSVSSPISKSFFGMTIQNLAATSSTKSPELTPFPQYSLSALRLWDVVNWMTIESTPGSYDWSKMDGTISVADQHGVSDYIFTFGDVPAWASTNPTDPCLNGEGLGTAGACAPPDLTDLDDFTRNVVRRYCGVVKYYEPWNEPNTAFWDGTNEQLLTVVKHIYTIVKDPTNCGCANGVCSPGGGQNPNNVLLPSTGDLSSNSLAWLDAFLSTSGSTYPYSDIASFHQYNVMEPENAIAQVATFRNLLSQHGLGNLELWDTEASWGQDEPNDGPDEAAWLMRFHMMEIAAGISRFFWYSYDNCEFGTLYVNPGCWGKLGADNTLTDPGIAYQVMQNWLIGSTVNRCLNYSNGLWMCDLTRSDGSTAWILWSSSGTVVATVPQDSSLTVYRDWENNANPLPSQITIDTQPVLLE